MSDTIELAKELIRQPSVTPDDKDCQKILKDRLSKINFKNETLEFEDVTNLWSLKGDDDPIFCFAGHTDVVPSGPLNEWKSDPFKPEIRDGLLFGRGAADMKGSIAAMITATERFISNHPNHTGSLAFLITSDEEGIAKNGTRKVIDVLEERNRKIKWCLVGEPSSTDKVGDTIKNGRRGSFGSKLIIYGIQGHVAYPHLAENPIHLVIPALQDLLSEHWDNGNDHFPSTTFQISNIHGGTGATNVIPGQIEVDFNLRYSTEITHQEIEEKVKKILDKYHFKYKIKWNLSGLPFLTDEGELVKAAQKSIKELTGTNTKLSTGGGTSDGRFIAPTGAQVLELGPINASIHRVNENVSVYDLNLLSDIYEKILENLLNPKH
tara:strand:+ start:4495 stop:5631 length:1137 start_codon:yes stop_codon:yes gene_type:complete